MQDDPDLDDPLIETPTTGFEPEKARAGDNLDFLSLMRLPKFRPSFYALVMCTGLFFFDQIDRYAIAATSTEIEAAQGWGNGKGTDSQYLALAGSIFNTPFLFAGLLFGYLGDQVENKQYIIATTLAIFSVATILTAFTTAYWQVALLRVVVALAEAATTNVGAPIVAAFFPRSARGSAMGIFNMGIYVGFGFAVGAGKVIASMSWRLPWLAFGFAGLIWACFVTQIPRPGLTYRSPSLDLKSSGAEPAKASLRDVGVYLLGTPSLLLLFVGSLLRNAGGYVWAFQTDNYFGQLQGQSPAQIAAWMTWIPPVAGTLGAVLGGYVSDRIVKNQPPWKRLMVVVVSNILAAPFALGALTLPPPFSYLCLLPSNIIGEMWIGITVVVVIELSPIPMRGTMLAIYFFVVRLSGYFIDLVGPFTKAFGFRWALILLWPGNYILGSLVFIATLAVINRDLNRRKNTKIRLSVTNSRVEPSNGYTQKGSIND